MLVNSVLRKSNLLILSTLRTTTFLTLVAIFCAVPAFAQRPEANVNERAAAHIDSLLEASVAEGGPGHAVRVIQDGDVVYDRALGLANLSDGTPLSSSTPGLSRLPR